MSRPLLASIWLFAFVPFLAGARASAAADVNQGWLEVRSPHFVVSSNAGEKEARRVADQFEKIRSLFHPACATLSVDTAQTVLILPAKNEKT
jgi:hypothetical protein